MLITERTPHEMFHVNPLPKTRRRCNYKRWTIKENKSGEIELFHPDDKSKPDWVVGSFEEAIQWIDNY